MYFRTLTLPFQNFRLFAGRTSSLEIRLLDQLKPIAAISLRKPQFTGFAAQPTDYSTGVKPEAHEVSNELFDLVIPQL